MISFLIMHESSPWKITVMLSPPGWRTTRAPSRAGRLSLFPLQGKAREGRGSARARCPLLAPAFTPAVAHEGGARPCAHGQLPVASLRAWLLHKRPLLRVAFPATLPTTGALRPSCSEPRAVIPSCLPALSVHPSHDNQPCEGRNPGSLLHNSPCGA